MSYQRRKYIITNLDNGSKIELNGDGSNNEPQGWEDSEKTWKRSTKDFSFTFELSKNLKFTGNGAAFLRNAYANKDIEAKVEIKEYRPNPSTDVFQLYSVGTLDFSKYVTEKTTVSMPIKSGGLKSLMKSKLNDKFELERIESIDGEVLPPLIKQEFAIVNRPLFLDSKSETTEEDKNSGTVVALGVSSKSSLSVPLSIVYNSDTRFTSSLPNQSDETPAVGLSAACFYYNNDIDKVFDLKITAKGSIKIHGTGSTTAALCLVVYENDETLNVKERIVLQQYGFTTIESIKPVNVSYRNTDYGLKKGQSLALQWYLTSGGIVSYVSLQPFDVISSVQITENSVVNHIDRRSQCVLNKDAGQRGLQIITGKDDNYVSEYLTSGEFKLSAITTGKLIRGFKDSKLTVSLKDFFNNCKSVYNMAYNIETIQGKEVVIHEPLSHFFRNEAAVKITTQVSNVKRSVASEFVFSTIKSGYKKPSGDNLYEEVNGQNEISVSNNYITPITRITKDYNIESPFRADSEGKELTLRQSILVNPTGDYRTDKTIFNLDLKTTGTSILEEKIWSDHYSEKPKSNGSTELYSVDTITGLALTPYRNMERHFWFLGGALSKHRDKHIRYTDTRGNSEVITKKAGETEKAENGKYLINDIDAPRFLSQWIEFNYKLDFDLLEKINGTTNVNGREIPNTYFKIEFINEFNQKERGYLFELKPSKEGKWKLLKAV